MKQNEIALIIFTIFISIGISLGLSKVVFTSHGERNQQVEVVQAITDSFSPPDERYFNDKAFDPTQPISIGKNTNPNPFNSTTATLGQ